MPTKHYRSLLGITATRGRSQCHTLKQSNRVSRGWHHCGACRMVLQLEKRVPWHVPQGILPSQRTLSSMAVGQFLRCERKNDPCGHEAVAYDYVHAW